MKQLFWLFAKKVQHAISIFRASLSHTSFFRLFGHKIWARHGRNQCFDLARVSKGWRPKLKKYMVAGRQREKLKISDIMAKKRNFVARFRYKNLKLYQVKTKTLNLYFWGDVLPFRNKGGTWKWQFNIFGRTFFCSVICGDLSENSWERNCFGQAWRRLAVNLLV